MGTPLRLGNTLREEKGHLGEKKVTEGKRIVGRGQETSRKISIKVGDRSPGGDEGGDEEATTKGDEKRKKEKGIATPSRNLIQPIKEREAKARRRRGNRKKLVIFLGRSLYDRKRSSTQNSRISKENVEAIKWQGLSLSSERGNRDRRRGGDISKVESFPRDTSKGEKKKRKSGLLGTERVNLITGYRQLRTLRKVPGARGERQSSKN